MDSVIKELTVTAGKINEIQEAADFAVRINSVPHQSSSFCSEDPEAVRQDISESIKKDALLVLKRENKLAGILYCYVDEEKNRSDCTLLVDTAVCSYMQAAEQLYGQWKRGAGKGLRNTFFFSKKNRECAAFLESIGARKQVNEFGLLMKNRGGYGELKMPYTVRELAKEDYPKFQALHDEIFPDVYISGKEVLADIGTIHFVFGILEDGQLNAYAVLRKNRGERATAELVGVRREFRGRGYGRAVLSCLLDQAFNGFGMSQVDLIVDGDNESALSLYLDMGFEVEFENCSYIEEGWDNERK